MNLHGLPPVISSSSLGAPPSTTALTSKKRVRDDIHGLPPVVFSRRIIRYFFPKQGAWKVEAPKNKSDETIYKTIEWFCRLYQLSKLRPSPDKVEDIKLGEVINLHNIEGVSHIQTMRELIDKIKLGVNIVSLTTGAPNVHLAKVNKQWVAINGHHTLMAYMIGGATNIAELPHLIVQDSKTGDISAGEIMAVFGKYANTIDISRWQQTVLNWSASEHKRLTARIQSNMQELTRTFITKYGAELNL